MGTDVRRRLRDDGRANEDKGGALERGEDAKDKKDSKVRRQGGADAAAQKDQRCYEGDLETSVNKEGMYVLLVGQITTHRPPPPDLAHGPPDNGRDAHKEHVERVGNVDDGAGGGVGGGDLGRGRQHRRARHGRQEGAEREQSNDDELAVARDPVVHLVGDLDHGRHELRGGIGAHGLGKLVSK